MNLLGLVGLLMDYPEDALWANAGELRAAVASVATGPQRRGQLAGFVEQIRERYQTMPVPDGGPQTGARPAPRPDRR